MKINPEKSKEMTICFAHHAKHRSETSCLTVDRTPVPNVTHAKLLGVTISCDLTWNRHVDNIIADRACYINLKEQAFVRLT